MAYQALQFFRLGSAIILSILLVKFGYSKDEIGDFEWFLFITNAISFFWSMGFINALKSYFPKRTKEEQPRLIFNLLLVFIGFGLLSICCLYFSKFSSELYNKGNWLYFCLFLVLGISSSITEHILILRNKAKQLFRYGAFSYGIYLIGLSLISITCDDFTALFMGLALWAFLRFVYTLHIIYTEGDWVVDITLISNFLLFASPLIINMLLGGGMEYVDGYLVDTYYSRSDFTIFRYGARELPINTIFITAMVSTMVPLAVVDLSGTLKDMKIRLAKLMNWLFPVSLALIFLSPILFKAVYNDGYIESAFVFNIYLLILCSRIVLPQVIIYAKQKNNLLMWIGLIELIVNICFSLLFMKYYGILGIAFATVIAYIIQKILMIAYCKFKLNYPVSSYLDLPRHLFYSSILYLAFFVSYYIYA